MLCQRKAKHNNQYKRNITCKSRILYEKYTDVRIELLECCPCDNKEELAKREGECIRNNECINKQIPLRTNKEHYQDNKQYKLDYEKEYREKNEEKIKERKSIRVICDCGMEVNKNGIVRHKKSQRHQDMVNTFGNLK